MSKDAKNHSAGGQASMSLVPQVFLFIPGERCVVHPKLFTESDLEELLVWYFPNFDKVRELKLRRPEYGRKDSSYVELKFSYVW
jgi:hypothetical protein